VPDRLSYDTTILSLQIDCVGSAVLTAVALRSIPVTGRGDPLRCETSRLTDGGKVVTLIRRPTFTPTRRFLLLISVRG
jgi:hypothetical protein